MFDTIDSRGAEAEVPEIEVLPRQPSNSAAGSSAATLCDCGRPLNHRGRHAKAATEAGASTSTSAAVERGTQWSVEDMQVMQTAVIMLLMGGTVYVQQSMHVADSAMRLEEAQAVAAPATRMMLRHVHVKRARRGDLADSVALTSALLAYGLRVLAAWSESNHGVQHAATYGNSANGANGTADDWAAAYRVGPQQSSENGSAT